MVEAGSRLLGFCLEVKGEALGGFDEVRLDLAHHEVLYGAPHRAGEEAGYAANLLCVDLERATDLEGGLVDAVFQKPVVADGAHGLRKRVRLDAPVAREG